MKYTYLEFEYYHLQLQHTPQIKNPIKTIVLENPIYIFPIIEPDMQAPEEGLEPPTW